MAVEQDHVPEQAAAVAVRLWQLAPLPTRAEARLADPKVSGGHILVDQTRRERLKDAMARGLLHGRTLPGARQRGSIAPMMTEFEDRDESRTGWRTWTVVAVLALLSAIGLYSTALTIARSLGW